MRFLRPAASWFAVVLLLYRGSILGWPWALDLLKVLPPKSWGPWKYHAGLNFPWINDAMAFSPLWALVALCLLAPSMAFLYRRLFGPRPSLSDAIPSQAHPPFGTGLNENPWPDRINLAGRWGFAVIYASDLLGTSARGMTDFLLLDPERPGFMVATPWGQVFMTFFYGILAAILIAPEISQLASSGLTGFIDAVFFPNDRDRVPPYTLKLARFYVQQKRWTDADAEFERVLSHHPQRLEAWIERLEAACVRSSTPTTDATADPDSTPEAILAAALKSLKTPADRDSIHTRFTQLRF
ncbi:MAG: hypothetical protein JWL81_192 [Verrucomicrobiales bacterium]|nr:hypothetical protein [Verrucomicrobiales bacterium]